MVLLVTVMGAEGHMRIQLYGTLIRVCISSLTYCNCADFAVLLMVTSHPLQVLPLMISPPSLQLVHRWVLSQISKLIARWQLQQRCGALVFVTFKIVL
jgi:hypothetical protein